MSKSKVAKVPMVMQMEAVECGAASLTMILAHYGKWLPLEEVRVACGVSRDGSSAKSILRAARNYGLEAKGYRTSPEALEGKQPAIIHWNFEHFVVFRGFDRKGRACLNDPGAGPVKWPMEEFRKHFTGVCLTFQPTAQFEKGGQQTSIVSYTKKSLKGAEEAFWITFTFALMAAFVALITPLFTRIFLDEILSGKNADWAPYFFTGMGALAVYQFFVVLLQNRYAKRVAGALALKGNKEYLHHLLRLPMPFFAMRNVGDLQQRMHLNKSITHSLINVLAPQVINLALLVLYLMLMLSYSFWLTLIGLLAAAINLAIVAAILSSAADIAIDPKTCFAGEMGLNGEIRPVTHIDQRIAEADKLGFTRMFLSKYNLKGLNHNNLKIKLIPISKVEEIYKHLFE